MITSWFDCTRGLVTTTLTRFVVSLFPRHWCWQHKRHAGPEHCPAANLSTKPRVSCPEQSQSIGEFVTNPAIVVSYVNKASEALETVCVLTTRVTRHRQWTTFGFQRWNILFRRFNFKKNSLCHENKIGWNRTRQTIDLYAVAWSPPGDLHSLAPRPWCGKQVARTRPSTFCMATLF